RRRVSLQAPRHVFGRVEDCARVVRQRKSVRRPYFGEYRRTSHRSPAPFGAAAFARFAGESCLACEPKRPKSAKVGGARRDRTADLVNAIHALSHLSYGPNPEIQPPLLGKRRKWSALFFLFDRLADDVGYVGVAFFLFLDEGRIVQALVANLDFFLFAGRGRLCGSRLLALLFGLRVLERNEFGVGGLWHDGFGWRRRRTRRRYGFGSRARRSRRSDWHNFACIR